ncbi:hypothetical protein [Streptosporangium pseudovulgare]|nr:hypothetical protein [Streptosporangium pseudovulgare]
MKIADVRKAIGGAAGRPGRLTETLLFLTESPMDGVRRITLNRH